MSIWKQEIDLENITKIRVGTLADRMGIVFKEFGEDWISASMPINESVYQPMGIMHGGASCVLAETVGSVAACLCVDFEKYHCVGLDIHTNHIRMVRDGLVTGTARPIHLGRSTQVWEVRITDDSDRLISDTRLTVMVIEKSRIVSSKF